LLGKIVANAFGQDGTLCSSICQRCLEYNEEADLF